MDELIAGLVDCFTDRVFLRDVHRLPGAVESGIVPPTRPIGDPGGDLIGPPPRNGGQRPIAPAAPTKTARPGSLTEELQQLFVAGRPEPEALGNDLAARAVESPASPIPLAAIKAAPPTGSTGEFGDEDYATERVSAQRAPATHARSDEDTPTGEFERATATPPAPAPRRRHQTAPLASRGKK